LQIYNINVESISIFIGFISKPIRSISISIGFISKLIGFISKPIGFVTKLVESKSKPIRYISILNIPDIIEAIGAIVIKAIRAFSL
jgi:hypothetical protein